jgi:hypothetical protein
MMKFISKKIFNLIESEGLKPDDNINIPFNSKIALKTNAFDELKTTFYELGGVGEEMPFHLPPVDIEVAGVLIQIDDELSFNRYRNITLRSNVYKKYSEARVENYKRFCRQYEKECLKAGVRKGIWSNHLSENYFGASSDPGDFFGKGSSGWKFKAFQDYLQDFAAFVTHKKILRISTFENLMIEGKLLRLDKILETSQSSHQKHIINFLMRSIETIKA